MYSLYSWVMTTSRIIQFFFYLVKALDLKSDVRISNWFSMLGGNIFKDDVYNYSKCLEENLIRELPLSGTSLYFYTVG